MDAAIKEATQLAPEASRGTATDVANQKLVEMEHHAFALVGRHQPKEAQAILFSQEYEKQKRIYAQGMEQLSAQIQKIIDAQRETNRQRDFGRLAISLCIIPLMICSWLIAL